MDTWAALSDRIGWMAEDLRQEVRQSWSPPWRNLVGYEDCIRAMGWDGSFRGGVALLPLALPAFRGLPRTFEEAAVLCGLVRGRKHLRDLHRGGARMFMHGEPVKDVAAETPDEKVIVVQVNRYDAAVVVEPVTYAACGLVP